MSRHDVVPEPEISARRWGGRGKHEELGAGPPRAKRGLDPVPVDPFPALGAVHHHACGAVGQGGDETGGRARGRAQAEAIRVHLDGVPNHEAARWPGGIATQHLGDVLTDGGQVVVEEVTRAGALIHVPVAADGWQIRRLVEVRGAERIQIPTDPGRDGDDAGLRFRGNVLKGEVADSADA